jgi:ribosomal protein S1
LPLYLQDKFIKNVSDVVQKGDKVSVRVLSVDPKAGRIALSMKGMSGE